MMAAAGARGLGRRRLTPVMHRGPASQPRAVEPSLCAGTRPPVQCLSGAAVLAGHEKSKTLTGQRESLKHEKPLGRESEREAACRRRLGREREKHAGEAAAEKLAGRESLEQRRRSWRAEREPRAAQEKPSGREKPLGRERAWKQRRRDASCSPPPESVRGLHTEAPPDTTAGFQPPFSWLPGKRCRPPCTESRHSRHQSGAAPQCTPR